MGMSILWQQQIPGLVGRRLITGIHRLIIGER